MDIAQVLAEEAGIRRSQADAVIILINQGNTIPFIARYRKEMHGGLNDEILRKLDERLRYLRGLEERKETVLSSIREQGALTDELKQKIDSVMTLVELEDLYRPYRPKRRTRAMMAREKGLEPFAEMLLGQKAGISPAALAEKFVSEKRGVLSVEDAIAGAKDIIAEQLADEAAYRTRIRELTHREGMLTSAAKGENPSPVYEMYFQYEEPVRYVAGHRILALNRGERENALTVKIAAPEEKILLYLERQVIKNQKAETAEVLKEAVRDSYNRLIAPSIEREIRNSLTEKAEDESISVFGKNLTQLLMQPPISGQIVMGWDPAFRTGCKLAVVDATGKVLDTVVIYPTAPQNKTAEAKQVVKRLIEKYQITVISVGNGTASRESEQIIAEMLKEFKCKTQYVITNEAGASVYSASKLAAEEFPDFDAGQRSAVSIARRLQDPLAELVKIDPKSIGVGQYQHDMNQKKLGEALNGVVEDCVNHVGVDLNTASASLLGYVSGISKTVAKNIVAYREANGRFKNRRELLKVEKLGPKAFEQSAGFLRIYGGVNPLDATAVHPENYEAAEKLLAMTGFHIEDIARGGIRQIKSHIRDFEKMAAELGVGEMTLTDILGELEKPARDPREEMPKPILRRDVVEMKDLMPGMVLKGTVRNVIDFGAFVDIGVHQDGLVHISEICDRYIRHPLDVLSVGDVVTVKILSVNPEKKRISLTIKGVSGETE